MKKICVTLLIAAWGCAVAGCGGGVVKAQAARVRPSQVQAIFARRGIQLTNLLIYNDSDRPIIRSYAVQVVGSVGAPVAYMLVYETANDASVAARRSPASRELTRANLVLTFAARPSGSVRNAIRAALDAVP